MHAPVRIQLLGPFAVRLPDGRTAGPWARPSARRLVANLAVARGHRITRETLGETLFPGLDPGPAARAVAKALSMARAAIGPSFSRSMFAVDRFAIGLEMNAVQVDLDEHVDGLRRGLELPDPELINELGPALVKPRTLLEDDPYEEWAIEARDSLESIRAVARVALADALDRTGASIQSRIDAWRTVVDGDPGDEAGWLALVRAERDAGRPDRALRTSYQARTAIREALDLHAGPELETLHQELLAGAPGRTRPSRPVVARPTFGRERTLAALDLVLAELAQGRGRDVLLVGPAGIGKTRLLDDAVDLASARGTVIGRGASVPEDQRVPYASLLQALRDLPIELIPLKSRLARLLGQQVEGAIEPAAQSVRDLAFLTAEIVDAIAQLAQDRQVLLVLDDVQWVDPALRVVLQRLVATPGRRRWALLTAARADERDAPVSAGLGEVVPVPPLGDASIADLIRHTIGDADVLEDTIANAVRRSAGNPLFAQELARAGPDVNADLGALPERIADVIGRRFDQLSPSARRILPILSLGEETVRNDVILAALGDDPNVHDALDELASRSLVQRGDRGVRIAHPLIREAAVGLLNPIRRARVHVRYADAIDGLGIAHPEVALSAVRHRVAAWESGRLSEDAGAAAMAAWRGAHIVDEEFSIAATRDLLQVGLTAFEAAPSRIRTQLANEAGWALIRLGELEQDVGAEAAARTLFDRALALAVDDEARAVAWSALGGIPYRRGDMAGAMIIYREGLAALLDSEGVPAARLRSNLGWALYRAKQPGALELVAASAEILAEHGGPQIASRALDRLAVLSIDPDAALEASDRAFVHVRRSADRRQLGILLVHRAAIERRAGRLSAAIRSADEALATFRAAADAYMQSVCLWTRADVLDAVGDLESALAARDAEAALLLAIDNPRNLAACQMHRADLLRRLGRPDEAGAAAHAARIAAESARDPRLIADAQASAAADGDTAA